MRLWLAWLISMFSIEERSPKRRFAEPEVGENPLVLVVPKLRGKMTKKKSAEGYFLISICGCTAIRNKKEQAPRERGNSAVYFEKHAQPSGAPAQYHADGRSLRTALRDQIDSGRQKHMQWNVRGSGKIERNHLKQDRSAQRTGRRLNHNRPRAVD